MSTLGMAMEDIMAETRNLAFAVSSLARPSGPPSLLLPASPCQAKSLQRLGCALRLGLQPVLPERQSQWLATARRHLACLYNLAQDLLCSSPVHHTLIDNFCQISDVLRPYLQACKERAILFLPLVNKTHQVGDYPVRYLFWRLVSLDRSLEQF